MASSSSSPLVPAVSSQSWNHDVFLSFRGEDTLKTFVDHLYLALVQQSIVTYKDDETLGRGELIGPSILKAIEESQIAVVVFSKNYAHSTWCLDELTHIMKCKNTRGQIVMPIFYDVEPSEVRKQTEKYAEAFAKHDLENKNKVQSWRKTLADASNLCGWETKNIANGNESKGIREIVEEISLRLQPVTSSAYENLIGIAARMKGLKLELQIGSGGVRMVGIWGVGGGGKTTLASSVYDEISVKFDGCCFLKNIREESSRHGLEALQEKILSILGANSDGGRRSLINKRFRHRKVLLVLDDVDHLDQLDALAGSPDWFGEGSRVIITTRDEHLLKAHNVVVHDISLLKGDEAIELFRKHAHLNYTSISEDYELLSKEVVAYAGGLPLALKVLGSCLCDKNIQQWRSALARLKNIPDANILGKLKVSYDGLEKVQKKLFLDIACLLRWEFIHWAIQVLDACGYHPDIGVEELRQKAFITIDSVGRINMHDLVQEMGHHIVRGEYPNNPEKHTRVWKKKDVLKICDMHATEELDMIEAIRFYRDSSQVFPPIVANMKNLRWIHWESDIASPLPNNFQPRELCFLILKNITQKQVWEGYKYLPNLKIMELWHLNKLIITPNFDGLPNLENFVLIGSPDLEEIHPSFGNLERLVSLRIEKCRGIKKFPSITRPKKLETLSFSDCPGLFERSEIHQKMDNSPHNHIRLCFSCRDLRNLNLSSCNLGDEDMSSAVWELPNLQQFDLSRNKFSRLDFGLLGLPRLKLLDVSYCSYLVELSDLPSSIAVLEAHYCDSLESIGDISNCKWLWKVSLKGMERVDGDMLLESMLKVNAIEDHCISVTVPHGMISKGVVDGLFKGNTFRLQLPHDWYSGFSGFLIHLVTFDIFPVIDIMMKDEEVDKDPPIQLWQESDEELESGQYRWKPTTYVGYVSFGWLRRNACLNSTDNLISFSLHLSKHSLEPGQNRIGAALVPRKSEDPLQTTILPTDFSQFFYTLSFRDRCDSKSSTNIIWEPSL